MNTVQLSGWLAREPEAKYFDSGTCLVTTAIGVQEYQKDKDKRNFIEIKVWGKTGETLAQYCQKGSFILVTGRLDVESWEAKDGGKRSKTVVVVDRLDFPPKQKDGSSAPANQGGVNPEEVPF